MTASDLSGRQERAAERILEDETLTADLTDDSATTLINWASDQASTLAGDADRSDEQVDEAVGTLRKAVRAVAGSGETDGQKLVTQAAAALKAAIGSSTSPTTDAAPAATPPASEKVPASTEASQAAPAADSSPTPATHGKTPAPMATRVTVPPPPVSADPPTAKPAAPPAPTTTAHGKTNTAATATRPKQGARREKRRKRNARSGR